MYTLLLIACLAHPSFPVREDCQRQLAQRATLANLPTLEWYADNHPSHEVQRRLQYVLRCYYTRHPSHAEHLVQGLLPPIGVMGARMLNNNDYYSGYPICWDRMAIYLHKAYGNELASPQWHCLYKLCGAVYLLRNPIDIQRRATRLYLLDMATSRGNVRGELQQLRREEALVYFLSFPW